MLSPKWHLETYLLYMFIGIVVYLLIQFAEKNSKFPTEEFGENKKYRLISKICYFIAFIILTVFASLRKIDIGIGGTDAYYYINSFINSTELDINFLNIFNLKQREPFFLLLNYSIRSIVSSYRLYFFVIYGFISYSYLNFISKNFNKRFISIVIILFLPVFVYSFSAFRSSISLAVLLFAYTELAREKKMKFLMIVIIASLFHYTALIVAPIIFFDYYLKNRLVSRKIIFKVLVSQIIVFSSIGIFRAILISTRYASYVNEIGTIKGQIPIISISALCFIFYKTVKDYNQSKLVFIHLTLFNFVLVPIIIFLGAYRISDYFVFPNIVTLALIFESVYQKFLSKDKLTNLVFRTLIVVFVLGWVTFSLYNMSTYNHIMPYSIIMK